MDKIVGELDKCDECESLVDVRVEFHSRRGDFVKVCMNCLASAITKQADEEPQTEEEADGDYPSTEQLATIKAWDAADFHGLMEYIHPLWTFGAWGWTQDGDTYNVSTGGWSGNEDIIAAMRSNHIWWAFHWVQSRRGGHYVFCKDMMSEKKEKE